MVSMRDGMVGFGMTWHGQGEHGTGLALHGLLRGDQGYWDDAKGIQSLAKTLLNIVIWI